MTAPTTARSAPGRHLRRVPGRRGIVAALLSALVVLVGAAGLAPASAARLTLSAHQLTAVSAAPCSAATIAARVGTTSGTSSTQVVLSSVPTGCRGRTAAVRLYGQNGTPLATVDTAVTLAAADTTTVTVPSYSATAVYGVALTVETWTLPTSWTTPTGLVTGPVTPGPGTTFDSTTWTQVASSGTQACVTVQVSGTTGTVWRVDLHTDQRPFNGVTTGAGFQVHSPWWGRLLTADPVNNVISVGGRAGYETLTTGQPVTVTVCNYQLPAPVHDAALSYSQSSQAVTGNVGHACMATTVGVTGTAQFYAGWRADVDVQPLVSFFAARGITANAADVTVQGNYTIVRGTGTVFRVTPTAWDTWGVRDDTTQTFQVCLNP
ncbi:MAG TPA: hypothetical protein VGC57_05355 [Cellulomonas sp.]